MLKIIRKMVTLTKPSKNNKIHINNLKKHSEINQKIEDLHFFNTNFDLKIPSENEKNKKFHTRQRIESILDDNSFFLELS